MFQEYPCRTSATNNLSFFFCYSSLAPSWMLPVYFNRVGWYLQLAVGFCICFTSSRDWNVHLFSPRTPRIFRSTSDPAKSSKGLGLAPSVIKENIHMKQQRVNCADSTILPCYSSNSSFADEALKTWTGPKCLAEGSPTCSLHCLHLARVYTVLCRYLFWFVSSRPILCFSIRRNCVGPTPCSGEGLFLRVTESYGGY